MGRRNSSAIDDRHARAVLGLPEVTSWAEIKKSYRETSKALHPDVCDLDDAAALFREAQEAFEHLESRYKDQKEIRFKPARSTSWDPRTAPKSSWARDWFDADRPPHADPWATRDQTDHDTVSDLYGKKYSRAHWDAMTTAGDYTGANSKAERHIRMTDAQKKARGTGGPDWASAPCRHLRWVLIRNDDVCVGCGETRPPKAEPEPDVAALIESFIQATAAVEAATATAVEAAQRLADALER